MRSRALEQVVLVTFSAVHADPYPRNPITGEYEDTEHDNPLRWGPTLRAVADRRSSLFARVSDLCYLCHPAVEGERREKGRCAREVGEDTKAAIERHLSAGQRPRFHLVTWQTNRPPNDHAHLFEVVTRELRAIRAAHLTSEIVLMIGTGTPAMHAILLVAGSVGIIDGPIRILQAERGEGVRRRPHTPLAEVGFELDTILRVARGTVPAIPGGDETPSLAFDQARSPALRRALAEAHRAARVRFPLLLRGERGVGKSTIASIIRAAGPFRDPRRDQDWPSVACGQFTDADRLNAEVCGYKRGAFTGASSAHPGLLHHAHKDTLFLDEVHDLDARSQRALIRVIEEGVYYRLGENIPRRSSFRLITGTNQPDDVLRQRLAPDFLDRIRDIEIVLPPLRECQQDLPWMWWDTWVRVARQCGVAPTCLADATPRVVSTLASHPLPGNWRDLRRLAVRLAVVATESRTVTARQLDEALHDFCAAELPAMPAASAEFADSPRIASKRDANRLHELESTLGVGLSALWDACRGGKGPELALRELLGDRHRARRAATFIKRVYSDAWRRHAAQRT